MKRGAKASRHTKTRKEWVSVRDTPFYDPRAAAVPGKVRVTMYLDSDVLRHFKTRSAVEREGYQTLINRVLRRVMEIEQNLGNTVLRDALAAIKLTASEATEVIRHVRRKSA